MVRSAITLSGSSFYQKIIRKYQTGEINSFGFPIMIFCKNMKHLLPQRINMDVLIQFHFHNLNAISSLIAKGVQGTKELLRSEKRILQFIQKFENLKSPKIMQYKITSGTLPKGDVLARMIHHVSFLKSTFSQSGNMRFALNNVLQPYLVAKTAMYQRINYYLLRHGDYVQIQNPQTLSTIGSIKHQSSVILSQSNISLNNALLSTSFYSQTYYNDALQDGTATHQLLNYGNYIQNINSQVHKIRSSDKPVYTGRYLSTDKESKLDYHSGFKTKSPVILSKSTYSGIVNHPLPSISSQEFKMIYQNLAAFIKPIIKSNNYNNRFNATSFIQLYKSDVLKDTDDFYFQNTLKIEQKIEQKIERVEKIAEEAKEAVKKISIPAYSEMDMRRQIDTTRLSDQVYQNIERRIKIEKERRGI